MTQIAVEVTGDDRKATQAIAKLQQQVAALEAKLASAGRAGKKTGDDMSSSLSKAVSSVGSMVAGYFSLSTVLNVVAENFRTLNANAKEFASTQDKILSAGRAILAGGGSEQTIKDVLGIAKQAKIGDPSTVLRLFDALSDAMGGNDAGAKRELAEVLAVHRLGMPLSDIEEIGTRAGGVGADVGESVRQVWLAQERFRVSPELISRTMSSVQGMGSPGEGLALAAMFSSKLAGKQAASAFESVIGALGPDADAKLAGKFGAVGVTAEMTVLTKLEKFAELGIDTMKEFQAVGVENVGTANALAMAVTGLPRTRQLAAELATEATEEKFAGRVSTMLEGSPALQAAENRAQLRGEAETLQLFGPQAQKMSEHEEQLLIRGLALRRMGIEKGPLGSDQIDEQGRMVTGFWNFAWLDRMLLGLTARQVGPVALPGEHGEYLEMIKRVTSELSGAAQQLESAARNMKGGPALVPATEDR